MGSFFSGLWSWFSGSSISANLAKTALLGYVSRLLNDSIASDNSTSTNTQVDYGSRIQINPSTDNKIPVLYGEAYFGGMISDAYLSSDYKKMTYVLTLSEVTGNTISGSASSYTFNDVYLGGNRVIFKADGCTVNYTVDQSSNQDVSMQDLVTVRLFKGVNPIAPQGYSVSLPYSYQVVPGWTAGTHPMSNLIFAVVEVNYNRSKNVTSIPECTFHITNSLTLPGDVLNDYMQNTRYGASIASTDIDTSLVSLNTYATTGFSYKDINSVVQSGSITINGLLNTDSTVLSNMELITSAASSWLSYDIHTGKWTVIINKAGSSIASFTDSNIIGEIAISGTSLTQLNNVAYVKYQNTDIQDTTDFVKISIPENELFANEPRSSTQLDLPLTNKQAVAMKIGLQQLKQERIDKIIQFKSDYSYINIKAGDIIDVTSDVYGYTNKLFRVITTEETENDVGSIEITFTCLEYDATVYDYDIQEYLVETDDGILGQGSIGKPNAPTITKTEISNVPKIVINAVVPSGIVDAMEYWITFDTTVMNDSARTYVKIGEYSNTNGNLLVENTTVSYTYSQLGQSDFYVKVRGVNNLTTGPYSNPSGLIQYKPTVVANGINADSSLMDGMGIALTALGLMELLLKLDDLFGGDATRSLTEKVFDWFKDTTGVDLVGDAQNGTLAVAANIAIKNHGTQISSPTTSINFASPLVATGSGDVTVGFEGTPLVACGTPKIHQTLMWNGTCWATVDTCCDPSVNPLTPTNPETCPPPTPNPVNKNPLILNGYVWARNFRHIEPTEYVNCDNNVDSHDVITYISNLEAWVASNPGKDFIYDVDDNPCCPSSRLVLYFSRPVAKGSGDVTVKKSSDDSVGRTFSASSSIVNGSELIFGDASTLTLGEQYYINAPAGIANSVPENPSEAVQTSSAYTDKFTTFNIENGLEITNFGVNSAPVVDDLEKQKVNITTDIALYFNKPVKYKTGNITLHSSGGDITLSSSHFTSGNPFVINPPSNLSLDTEYWLTIPSGVLEAEDCGIIYTGLSDTDKVRFKTDAGPSYQVINNGETNLVMDREVVPNNTGSIRIYDMFDNLIKTISPIDNVVQFKG